MMTKKKLKVETVATTSSFDVNGIPVHFPLTPYAPQKEAASIVVRAIVHKQNALIESPTGTGKTLALLCGALASTEGSEKHRIFYCVRTHAQIQQVVDELARTCYRRPMAVLGARSRYCINEAVLRAPSIDAACSEAVRGRSCVPYANAKDRKWRFPPDAPSDVWQADALRAFGLSECICPYAASVKLSAAAGIVFCPYQYVLNAQCRQRDDLALKESDIVIFDEAHNMEDASRDAFCRSLSMAELNVLVGDLVTTLHRYPALQRRRAYATLFTAAYNAAQWLLDADTSSDIAHPRAFASSLVSDVDALKEAAAMVALDVEALRTNRMPIATLLASDAAPCSPAAHAALSAILAFEQARQTTVKFEVHRHDVTSRPPSLPALLPRLRTLNCLLSERAVDAMESLVVFCSMLSTTPASPDPLRVMVTTEERTKTATLHTLDPADVFAAVAGAVHCVILASGTLAPLASFESELGVFFPLRMEGAHVIDADRQLLATHLSSAASGRTLRCVHRETSEPAFQDALGDTIERLVRAIPHGVLVFLPSYTLFATLRRRWGETRRWDTIGGAKRLFCEPQAATQREFSAMLGDYYEAAECGEGAVLFAVFRGRCSEGMDFADGRARAVIGVGLPLPNLKSGLIEAKMAYNQARQTSERLSGNAWYTLQAWRALNQALGRCIRHRTDHGALILIDARFAERNGLQSLSRWVRERMAPAASVDALEARLVQFFESQ